MVRKCFRGFDRKAKVTSILGCMTESMHRSRSGKQLLMGSSMQSADRARSLARLSARLITVRSRVQIASGPSLFLGNNRSDLRISLGSQELYCGRSAKEGTEKSDAVYLPPGLQVP